MKPTLFIGSSTERLPVARALKELLTDCADVTVWREAPEFLPGESLLRGLISVGEQYDFAILVFGQDDCTMMSDLPCANVRDNVLFELGLFIGHMGRERALWVSPRGPKAPIFPTDLKGIVYLDFDEPDDLRDREALLNNLAETRPKIYQRIDSMGFRISEVVPMRRALCLASSEYEEASFQKDIENIHAFFHEGEVTATQGVTAESFYEYFSPGAKWDMIHLALYVDPENQNLLLDTDAGGKQSLSIPAIQGMIKDCGAALVVIITCDSLRFGQQLARFTNVIAGYQAIGPSNALNWAKVFYQTLSAGMPLFQAFDKAQDITDPGLVLLARKDVRFRRLSSGT